MNQFDTIAAVSTPHGRGGVAMIRITGSEAVAIGEKIFTPACGTPLGAVPAAREVYGVIRMPGEDAGSPGIDDGMAVRFCAPRSFTGEDTVEITCHGGILVTQKVLEAALCAGARMAQAGEFTRRAFVNGKMKLSQAEALGALLEAGTDSQLKLARGGVRGRLAERTGEIYRTLRLVLTSVYAAIDFPEEDLKDMSREEIAGAVSAALSEVRSLIATYRTGRAVSEGIPTVICGRANVGKSSVYNRILGYDAAIVTEIEGTTRDVLREKASLGRTTLLLCDTAGLRDTGDTVERLGIERTRQEIRQAGLILAVFDRSEPLTDEDCRLADELAAASVPVIALWNKSDEPALADETWLARRIARSIAVSARTGEGFDRLSAEVDALFVDGSLELDRDAVVTGARQYAALCHAAEALETAVSALEEEFPLDLCCVGIEEAAIAVGELDGRELDEEIVAEIFSRFCVGK